MSGGEGRGIWLGVPPPPRRRRLEYIAKELVREGKRRLVGIGWLELGLSCLTSDAGYFGMLMEPLLGSCLERRGRLEDRKGLG